MCSSSIWVGLQGSHLFLSFISLEYGCVITYHYIKNIAKLGIKLKLFCQTYVLLVDKL